jgi:hypothetical protein
MSNDIHNDSHIESSVTYKIPIEIDFDRDLREKANFIYEISREYLLATMDARKNLEKKAILILTFIFAAVSFCIARVLTIYSQNKTYNFDLINIHILEFLISVIAIYIIIAIVVVFKIFAPKDERTNGNQPENVINKANMDQYFPLMKIGEAQSYQSRIDFNNESNATYASTIKISLIVLVFVPVLGFISCFYNYF